MARYIDADALKDVIVYAVTVEEYKNSILRIIDEQATAVVPRAMIAEIFDAIEESLQYEIDLADKCKRNALAQGDVSGFQAHKYVEDKFDTVQIAISLYKKIFTEGEK